MVSSFKQFAPSKDSGVRSGNSELGGKQIDYPYCRICVAVSIAEFDRLMTISPEG